MAVIDYLPIAVAGGANVQIQADYAGSGPQLVGVVAGKAASAVNNKMVRQSSMMASALAHFISVQLGGADVADDGDLTALIALLTAAISIGAQAGLNAIVTVPFAAAMPFDASQGRNFETLLTGNNTSATLINLTPGSRISLQFKQDGTGGRVFTPPASLASMPLPNLDPNTTTNYLYFIDSTGAPRLLAGPNVS